MKFVHALSILALGISTSAMAGRTAPPQNENESCRRPAKVHVNSYKERIMERRTKRLLSLHLQAVNEQRAASRREAERRRARRDTRVRIFVLPDSTEQNSGQNSLRGPVTPQDHVPQTLPPVGGYGGGSPHALRQLTGNHFALDLDRSIEEESL